MHKTAIFFALIVILPAGCQRDQERATPATERRVSEEAVEQMTAEHWVDLYRWHANGTLDSLSEHIYSNATIWRPGPLSGVFYMSMGTLWSTWADSTRGLERRRGGFLLGGDLAIERGLIASPEATSPSSAASLTYMTEWHRDTDGKWKIALDVIRRPNNVDMSVALGQGQRGDSAWVDEALALALAGDREIRGLLRQAADGCRSGADTGRQKVLERLLEMPPSSIRGNALAVIAPAISIGTYRCQEPDVSGWIRSALRVEMDEWSFRSMARGLADRFGYEELTDLAADPEVASSKRLWVTEALVATRGLRREMVGPGDLVDEIGEHYQFNGLAPCTWRPGCPCSWPPRDTGEDGSALDARGRPHAGSDGCTGVGPDHRSECGGIRLPLLGRDQSHRDGCLRRLAVASRQLAHSAPGGTRRDR